MGCFFSSQKDDGSKRMRMKRRETYALKNEAGNYKTSAHKKEFNASNWEDDTKAIWERPLSSLSCHMDLPRLGHKMKVYFNDELIVKHEEGEASKMQVVQDIIISMAESCNESPELLEAIQNRYYEFVNEDGSGDISQQLKSFLEAVIPDNCKLSNILCLCHQKIVFPAYYSIKNLIHDDLPFKDSRGSWLINVFITEDSCTVIHSKIQMAKDSLIAGEDPEFSFKWELIAELSGGAFDNLKSVFVRIPEITTKDGLSGQREQEIRDIFEKHYPQN